MSMVTTVLHNPPIPAIPKALRVFLVCKMSRMTIMRVRRTLSESETEKYARPGQLLLDRSAVWKVNKMPIAILSTLVLSVAVSL